MKKKIILNRILGIFLAAMLTVESCIPAVAAENISMEQTLEQETEMTEEASIENILEETSEMTEVSQIEIESEKEETVPEEQSEEIQETEIVQESTFMEESFSEQESTIDSDENQTDELVTPEESQEENIIIESTEKETVEESSIIESTLEELTSEEITIEETSSIEEVQQVFSAYTTDKDIQLDMLAPTNLTITERTAGSVTLQWDTLRGCTGYQIYRSTTEDEGYERLETGIVTTDSNRAAYVDDTCEIGKIYYYKVLAYLELPNETIIYSAYSNIVSNEVALEGITLNKTEVSIAKGMEETIAVIYNPDYTTDARDITWMTENEEIAVVTDGVVTGVSAGTTTVTAQVGDFTASCVITVTVPLQQIVMDKQEIVLEKGTTEKLTVQFTPEDTTDAKQITWSSSNEEIVQITEANNETYTATINAKQAGEVDITAQVGDRIAACHVIVIISPQSIILNQTEIELLEMDDSAEVEVTVLPEDSTDVEVTWESEQPELVSCEYKENKLYISSQGILGDTQIKITVGELSAVLHVAVVPEKEEINTEVDVVPVNEVKIKADINEDIDEGILGTVNLEIGTGTNSQKELIATVLPEDATNKDIIWSSSDEDVVSVSDAGVVTAVGIGRATITATADNGISDSVIITVLPVDQEFRITNGTDITLYCNENLHETEYMKKMHQISLNKELTYEYRSSKSDIVSVNAEGIITALNPGKATITIRAKETGKVEDITVTVRRSVESITVPMEEITVVKGTRPQIPYTVAPQNVSKECLDSLSIETNKKNISSITWAKGKTSGVITFYADRVGTAKLTITAGDSRVDKWDEPITNISKEIIVHVVEEAPATVNTVRITGSVKMKTDTSQQLEVIVVDRERNELDIEAIGLPIGYTSSNEEILTVDAQGRVTAKKGGRANVTAYVLDGSNKKAIFAITVEQRPESISLERDTFAITKAANAAATIALTTTIYPTTTASSARALQWEIVEVRNADDTVVDSNPTDYFTVNTAGRVTATKKAQDGMYAIVRCTSKAYEVDEKIVSAEAKVVVQVKRINAIRFKTANVQMIGLTEAELPFIPTFSKGYNEAVYTAISSDESIAEIVSIENNAIKLRSKKYGTVTITLYADNAIKTTCRVTVYPFERGAIRAKEATYTLQQAQYDGTDKAVLRFVDSKTQKIEIDPTLLSYQSSNPDVVYVDENGIAYANPSANGKVTTRNNQVTITATLKDDPDKRRATVRVIVCPTEQIERMDVTFYRTDKLANQDITYSDGKILTDQGTSMVYDTLSRDFVLRVFSYGADHEEIKVPKIRLTSSDTGIAYIKSFRLKQSNEHDIWEAVVSIKKPGRFKLMLAAQDQKKVSREIAFCVYSGEPILESANLGSINKHIDAVQINQANGIASKETFTIIGTDGTEIKEVSVKSAQLRVKENGKVVLKTYNCEELDYFRVESLGNNQYRLVVFKDILENAVDGTYAISLNVKRSALPGDIGFGSDKVKTISSTYKLQSTLPRINNTTVTINSFIRGDAVKIPIQTTEQISNVSIATGMMLLNEVDIFKKADGWYVKLKDEKFETWKKSATSGKLQIELEGYETPVVINLTVRTIAQKPVIRQAAIPSVHLEHSNIAYVNLIDAKKQTWSDITASCKAGNKSVFDVEVINKNQLKVTFRDTDMKLRGQGANYTEKVLINKPEWKTPMEIAVSVKAYNGKSVPTIRFAQSTVSLNKQVGENAVATDVIVSMDNVELLQGEWKISDTCKYRVVQNRKTVWYQCSEAFQAIHENGKLKIVLKNPDIVPKGTYRLTMTNVWDAQNDEGSRTPLTTAAISVVVKDIAPTVRIQMSGRLDLINRSNSTLKGKVTVTNVNSTISRIRLVNTNDDGFADKFYCIRKGQEFTLYARSNAELTTTNMKGTVEITMSDGTVLTQVINFRPMQSVPGIKNVTQQRIYKSARKQSTDFNLNNALTTKGVSISKIIGVKVPKGITVQDSNGHLIVTLENKTLKAGRYAITVNMYFKGAQVVKGNSLGQPVTRTIYVEVKE